MIEYIESRPHKAVTFVVDTGMERAKNAEGVAWFQWRKVTRKKHRRERRSEERRVRNEIIKEVMKGIKKMAVEESVKSEGKRTGGLDLMQSWDCSQIENEED